VPVACGCEIAKRELKLKAQALCKAGEGIRTKAGSEKAQRDRPWEGGRGAKKLES